MFRLDTMIAKGLRPKSVLVKSILEIDQFVQNVFGCPICRLPRSRALHRDAIKQNLLHLTCDARWSTVKKP